MELKAVGRTHASLDISAIDLGLGGVLDDPDAAAVIGNLEVFVIVIERRCLQIESRTRDLKADLIRVDLLVFEGRQVSSRRRKSPCLEPAVVRQIDIGIVGDLEAE